MKSSAKKLAYNKAWREANRGYFKSGARTILSSVRLTGQLGMKITPDIRTLQKPSVKPYNYNRPLAGLRPKRSKNCTHGPPTYRR